MSAIDSILPILTAASVICSTPGVVLFASTLFSKTTLSRIGSSNEILPTSQSVPSGYSSCPTDTSDPCDPSECSTFFWPRTHVWMQQLCVLSSAFLIIREIYTSCDYLSISCYFDSSHILVISLVYCTALLCDALNKISSKNWKIRSLWVPVYAINSLYLVLNMFRYDWNNENNGNNGNNEGNGSISVGLASATFFAVLGTFFAIIAAIGTKPIILINPPTKEYTVGLSSYLTFSYINKDIVHLGMSKASLELEDVPGLIDGDTCSCVYKTIDSLPHDMPLGQKLCRLVFLEFLHQTVFQAIGSVTAYAAPLALRVILAHMGPASKEKDEEATGKGIGALFTPSIFVIFSIVFSCF